MINVGQQRSEALTFLHPARVGLCRAAPAARLLPSDRRPFEQRMQPSADQRRRRAWKASAALLPALAGPICWPLRKFPLNSTQVSDYAPARYFVPCPSTKMHLSSGLAQTGHLAGRLKWAVTRWQPPRLGDRLFALALGYPCPACNRIDPDDPRRCAGVVGGVCLRHGRRNHWKRRGLTVIEVGQARSRTIRLR